MIKVIYELVDLFVWQWLLCAIDICFFVEETLLILLIVGLKDPYGLEWLLLIWTDA